MSSTDDFLAGLAEGLTEKGLQYVGTDFDHNGEMFSLLITKAASMQSLVDNVTSLEKEVRELKNALAMARDFVSDDGRCGPAGVGLICIIDDVLNKD